jgi:hypothetical protein
MAWYWTCSGRDEKHGCFSADFDGTCSAYFRDDNKHPYKTKEAVIKAARAHERKCRFPGSTSIYTRGRGKKIKEIVELGDL